jgi:DNA-binding CsgD family transcriptional regulator
MRERGIAPPVHFPRTGRRGGSRQAKPADLLSIVETAYDVESPQSEWLRGLLDATDRSLGAELGGFACAFDAGSGGLTLPLSHAVVRQAPETVKAILDALVQTPPPWVSRYMANPRSASICTMTSEVDPKAKLSYRTRLAREGVHDGVNIVCMGSDRHGVLISLGVQAGFRLTPNTRRHLAQVATHVVAAQRLRRRLDGTASVGIEAAASAEAPGAILSAEGKILHANGDTALANARRALHDAVCDIESARTSWRDDEGKALDLWKGLVSARWTLVEQFDAQGKRYILARENAPASAALAKLSPTESCVVRHAAQGYTTKEIAYTLGISPTTVRVLIMRAVHRCGVRSRAELLQLVSVPLAPTDPFATQ